MRDLSDRFRVVSVLGFLRIHSAFSHYYQWFPVSPDNMCMSEADHKTGCLISLWHAVRLQPPALASGYQRLTFQKGQGVRLSSLPVMSASSRIRTQTGGGAQLTNKIVFILTWTWLLLLHYYFAFP